MKAPIRVGRVTMIPMRFAWSGLVTASFLFAAATAGCGGGGGVAPPPPGDGGAMDTGVPDAQVPIDAGPGDAGMADAATDAGVPPCTFNPGTDLVRLGDETYVRVRRVALAPGPDGVLAVWAQSDNSGNNIHSRYIASTGPVDSPYLVTNDTYLHRDPAVARVGSAYLAAWVDNSNAGAGYEIEAQPFTTAALPTGTPARVTNNTVSEQALAMTGFGSGALLVWYENVSSDHVLRAVVLDSTGHPTGMPVTIRTDPSILSPSVVATSTGALVAWTELVAGPATDGGTATPQRRVALQQLDSTGAMTGSVAYADQQMNASGTADLAMAASGAMDGGTGVYAGSVVYGVNVSGTRPEVRWRALNADGSVPAGSAEVPITGLQTTGSDPSVAAYAGGFAVAYRVLSDPQITGPAVRLVLADNAGANVGHLDVADTFDSGFQSNIEVGLDGGIVMGWMEQNTSTSQATLWAARLRCGP